MTYQPGKRNGSTAARQIAAALAMALGLLVILNPAPGRAGAPEQISGLRIGAQSESTRIVLDLSGKLPYSLFTLADPYRIVIDLPELEWAAQSQSASSSAGLVSGYRFGLFRPGNSRFVLDLSQPARIVRIFFVAPPSGASGAKPASSRLVIDLARTNRDEFLKTAGFKNTGARSLAALASSATPPPVVAPQIARPATWKSVAGLVPPPNPRRATPPAVPGTAMAPLAVKPMPPLGAGSTSPRILVIDAGHGGVDPGAMTANGVYEKTIVLDVARRLQALLERSGRYKIIMTRNTDVFVPLGDRVQVARKSEASLFVSIHADALVTRKVRGASVYTLSEQASDKEAELLAAKENNSDMIAGIGIGGETDELVKSILIDLAQRETTNKSVHFAKLLLPELNSAGALLKNSHRYAGFKVLKAPDVPSVLVELGLLSNNADARTLTSNAGRQRLAEALKDAIATYFRNLET